MSATAGEIQEEMGHVRSEIRDDVRGIFAGARAMTDWRHYLRQYPWVALGVAAAVGFWIVPARTVVFDNSLIDLADAAREHKDLVDPSPPPQESEGALASTASVAMSSLLQSAVAIGMHQLGQFLNGRTNRQPLSRETGRNYGTENHDSGFTASTPVLPC